MFDPHIEAQLTKQHYGPSERIVGVEMLELKEFADDGGSFLELGRLDAGMLQCAANAEIRQVNYSTIVPGAVKATHLHRKQTDFWFVPSADRLLVGLKDLRTGSPTQGMQMRFVLGAARPRMVRIPPGVAHGVANPYERPMSLIYFVTEQFDPESDTGDEYRLPPDIFGPMFWDIQAG
ncbi:MAG: dTDP-4-dehydrorhamnose 3,5-epimerase family protein [bacterium]|nr:dTDP-4-dehydrorhamnose 3,5-epimerase family protein [bacterium]